MIKAFRKVFQNCSFCNQQRHRQFEKTSHVLLKIIRLTSSKPRKKMRIVQQTEDNYKKARPFVDFRRCRVMAGSGGNGCVSFLSLPKKEWAGPDGGDGGNGGHVIFKADTNIKALEHVEVLIRAEKGTNGGSKNCHGRNAEHTCIKVPVGTIFKNEDKQFLADLTKEDEIYVAARGGAGGKGNYFFLSNKNRAPAYAEDGAKGEEKLLLIELRVMAHAGLVGFPNAGKSTLLRAISKARPRVASYPFTTLNPHVGIVPYDDHIQVAVADIPGLIPDAHMNRGLGISFLRHIERCICLLYVIDLSIKEPWTQFYDLQYELEQYQTGLSKRPHAIIGNKIDLPVARKHLELLQEKVDLPVFAVSGKKLLNTDKLILHLRELYDKYGD